MSGHDLRINLLLGMANWFVFLDHIPNNAVNLVTLRNYGFSGATDVFVFVAGYAVALIYGAMMLGPAVAGWLAKSAGTAAVALDLGALTVLACPPLMWLFERIVPVRNRRAKS